MISLLFYILAIFFNSCMDAFENTPNFNESIFKNLNKNFWCKDVSWQYAKKIFNYKIDSWHISKTLMIASFGACIIFAYIYPLPVKNIFDVLFFVGVGYIGWGFFFWLFYHKLFKIK